MEGNSTTTMPHKSSQQQYAAKPLTKKDVRGKSARVVFKFMTTSLSELSLSELQAEEKAQIEENRKKVDESEQLRELRQINDEEYYKRLGLVFSVPSIIKCRNSQLERMAGNYPHDIDDFERIRALLLCYPEWLARLPEMAILSGQWKAIVENYTRILELYEADYVKYGNKGYGIGK
jgi:hypothetical protein